MTGLICSVCGAPQFDTPSGISCGNGHGGAPSDTSVFDGLPVPPEAPPALLPGYIQNFETLKRDCQDGNLALVSAIRKSDRQPVALVCAMQGLPGGEVAPVPFAEMISGNPYEMYEDPTI